MASLLLCHSFYIKSSTNSIKEPRNRANSRIPFFVSCQNRVPSDPLTPQTKEKENEKEKEKGIWMKILVGSEKLKDNLSPKKKGDWKDLMLMSLSFAVYVYISQRIVCAYCAWSSMLHHHW